MIYRCLYCVLPLQSLLIIRLKDVMVKKMWYVRKTGIVCQKNLMDRLVRHKNRRQNHGASKTKPPPPGRSPTIRALLPSLIPLPRRSPPTQLSSPTYMRRHQACRRPSFGTAPCLARTTSRHRPAHLRCPAPNRREGKSKPGRRLRSEESEGRGRSFQPKGGDEKVQKEVAWPLLRAERWWQGRSFCSLHGCGCGALTEAAMEANIYLSLWPQPSTCRAAVLHRRSKCSPSSRSWF
jgi:hypothetical protein